MAHLTNYTFGKLCRTLDIKKEINLELFLEYVYNDRRIFFILNKLQIKYLFNFRNLIEDESKYFVEYYQVVEEREDTQTYVYERAGRLKYHLDGSCSRIKSDFRDFIIPNEIQQLGNVAIVEYREWFKQNAFKERFEKESAILYPKG